MMLLEKCSNMLTSYRGREKSRHFDVIPGIGVGNLRFGMGQDEARSIAGDPSKARLAESACVSPLGDRLAGRAVGGRLQDDQRRQDVERVESDVLFHAAVSRAAGFGA